jgi:hypothetical protein
MRLVIACYVVGLLNIESVGKFHMFRRLFFSRMAVGKKELKYDEVICSCTLKLKYRLLQVVKMYIVWNMLTLLS